MKWECIYCDKEFNIKKIADKHELTCKKNPSNHKFKKFVKKTFRVVLIIGFSLFVLMVIISNLTEIRSIAGRSMLPTYKADDIVTAFQSNSLASIFVKPSRDDVVVFKAPIGDTCPTTDCEYIKRIIGVPGDKISLKGGFVYINDKLLDEPYTLKARSTFGNEFISDCKTITVPKDNYFVMGDNRNLSRDSRNFGFVPKDKIVGVLPFRTQSKSKYRDSSKDLDEQGKVSFNVDEYYDKLNIIRTDNGLKLLNRNEKLEKAAIARAKSIIENNEINILNKDNKSKYPYEKAIKDAGYYNVITGEVRTTGYFDAEELSNYWLEYQTKENILNKQFQDTGIGAFVGKIDDCEVQVIVQLFGGYVPPNYSKETINNWRKALNDLNSVIPSWVRLKGWRNINQDDLNKLLDLMYKEKNIASNILSKMESGKWLSNEDNRSIDEFNNLAEQSSALANKLNGR